MKLIEPFAVDWTPREYGLNNIYAFIEKVARVCYKSESRGDTNEFIRKLIVRKHFAMLEHGTVYLHFKHFTRNMARRHYERYVNNPYSKAVLSKNEKECFVTTNMRVLYENDWLNDVKVLEKCPEHIVRKTIKIGCSRAIAQELTRHRAFSFAMESQRYCNYSKDRFGGEVTYIRPIWYNGNNHELMQEFLESNEKLYLNLLENGLSPQLAREVLPNATKTELVMTGFEEDWKHFFDLRLHGTTGTPHPEMLKLAERVAVQLDYDMKNKVFIK